MPKGLAGTCSVKRGSGVRVSGPLSASGLQPKARPPRKAYVGFIFWGEALLHNLQLLFQGSDLNAHFARKPYIKLLKTLNPKPYIKFQKTLNPKLYWGALSHHQVGDGCGGKLSFT